ncbi:MAG: polyprenyl synthetase family protein [Planctomycetota bacterium]|jgi:octaprenyl-diphosphate synthase
MQSPPHSDPSQRSRAGTSGGLPQSTTPSFRLIDSELGQVKRLIDEQLAEARELVGRLLRSANIHGGKMIRPGLVLLSYRAVRDASCAKRTENAEKNSQLRKSATSGDSTVSIKQCNTQYNAICAAAIVELIHNATLLHDDVIDGGQKRRGRPTVNSLCGNESAVLLGDFLLSKAFKISANLDPEIANIIADTAVRVCVGELRQITERQNWQLSESEYIDIITEKSAALFSICCLLGGFLGGASETQIESLADFGLNAGIAFQITDDLLDIIGDEGETGKTPGSDIDTNKLTLAVIHLLKAVDEREKSTLINSYLANPVKNSKTNNMMLRGELSNVVNREACLERNTTCEMENLVEMLGRLGSLDYAHSRAQEFVTKALDALTDLKGSEAKDALIETAKFLGQRAI